MNNAASTITCVSSDSGTNTRTIKSSSSTTVIILANTAIINPLAALSHQNPNQSKSSSISISSDTQREIDEVKTAEKSTSTDDELIENELSQQQHAQSPKSIKKDNKTKSWRRVSIQSAKPSAIIPPPAEDNTNLLKSSSKEPDDLTDDVVKSAALTEQQQKRTPPDPIDLIHSTQSIVASSSSTQQGSSWLVKVARQAEMVYEKTGIAPVLISGQRRTLNIDEDTDGQKKQKINDDETPAADSEDQEKVNL